MCLLFCSSSLPNGCVVKESFSGIGDLITFVMVSVYALKTEQTSKFILLENPAFMGFADVLLSVKGLVPAPSSPS